MSQNLSSMSPTPSSSRSPLTALSSLPASTPPRSHRRPNPGQADSGIIEDATLTQGGSDTLNIVSLEYLDLVNLYVYLREAMINGKSGIPLNAKGAFAAGRSHYVHTIQPFNKQGSPDVSSPAH
ncbi:hypothetical protein EDD85DRAFT_959366 [Armillaria nabsnona]|nr:hypothetical protein EDD85DRAFT_959366 [Armillaria nabsnona]